ncbi:hypothetical protein ACFLVB_03170 [Chloroflexota bacterium]
MNQLPWPVAVAAAVAVPPVAVPAVSKRGNLSVITFPNRTGVPYPVDRKTCDQSIELLSRATGKPKIGWGERHEAFNRLNRLQLG